MGCRLGFLWLILITLLPIRAEANPVVEAFRRLRAFVPGELNSQWHPVASIPLYHPRFPTFHPQGIKLIGRKLYLSTVQGHSSGFGHLLQYVLDSALHPAVASPVRRTTFSPGPGQNLNHAGGLDGDEHRLYIPLAAYRPEGPTRILQVDLRNHQVRSIARVNDHIGTLIFDPEERRLHLFDWSVGLYTVPFQDLDFQAEADVRRTKSLQDPDWEYQDCKNIGDAFAICSAKGSGFFPEGEIHLVRFPKTNTGYRSGVLEVVHRVPVPNLHNDGQEGGFRPLTYNAMDFQLLSEAGNPEHITGMRFFFVPHDDEDSRLMIYDAIFSPDRVARRN
jgi:Family of unknown function (DUF6454)